MSAIQILNVISDNLELVVAIQQGLFSALSGLCAMVGWTKASKVLGTLTTLDLGRLVRYAQKVAAFRQALSGAAKGGLLVLLLVGCSGSPQQSPLVCPIPSELLSRLPPPAAVASAVQAAQGVVEQTKAVTQDPDAAAAVLVAAKALDTAEPLCPNLTELAKTDCASKVAEARAMLAKADATREQVCGAVRLAVIVSQIAEDSVPIVALEEVCR